MSKTPTPQEIEEALTGSCECGYGGSCGCQSKYRKILAASCRAALAEIERVKAMAKEESDLALKACVDAEQAEAALAAIKTAQEVKPL